ncbi:MAG: deoxyribose-phosphate aldolase [Legionella sp.]|nr:deoxyribose-phosphate aldolase [Legionella sp.]
MTFTTNLNQYLDSMVTPNPSITPVQIISCMDLTLLNEHANSNSFDEMNILAQKHKVAAVCVFIDRLSHFRNLSKVTGIATVINFPSGLDTVERCLDEIDRALHLGVTEIDYVLPYQHYLEGDINYSLNHCKAIAKSCSENRLKLKFILETGAFNNIETVYELSSKLIDMGADFIKTSTGKIDQGASPSSAFAILSAIRDSNTNCGIKISGGIKTPYQALQYASLAEHFSGKAIDKSWFRIGASSLLRELLK